MTKPNKPRILSFDIESAGVNALKSDLGFVILFGYKWAHESQAKVLKISARALRHFDDRELLVKMSKLFAEADLLVGHFSCVAPHIKVLMDDFTYKPAGELQVGDKLITIEEQASGVSKRRKFTLSAVKYAKIVNAPKLRLELSDGTTLDVTKNHPFLVPKGKVNGANWSWVNAENLKVGDVLTRIVPVWEPNYGYESGYLSAALDGEGHVNIKPGIKIGFAQKPNEMLNRFKTYFKLQGFSFKEYSPKTPVKRLMLAGGIFPALNLLGTVRPVRLLAKLRKKLSLLCMNVPLKNRTTIKSIRYIGRSSVVNLTTTSGTYITEGFASHNSVFDRRFIQGRLLINGLPPIPPTKMRDTCMIARSVANFSSNRLKHLAKILKFKHQKLENNWPNAWFDIMQGNTTVLNKLAEYCKGDVLAVEELYFKLRPYDNPHPRLITDRTKCGVCGGDVQYRGFMFIEQNKYRRYVCTVCSRWDHETTVVKE